MNTCLFSSTISYQRRRFLGFVAGVGVSPLSSILAAQVTPTFALISVAASKQLQMRVPVAAAERIIAQASAQLTRQPHFMPVVHTEGLLDGEGARAASRQAQEDWRQACLQALASRLGAQAEQAEHAACAERYLQTWVMDYAPSFNPIDETDLVALLYAFDLLQENLSAPLLAAMPSLGGRLADGYLSYPVRVGSATSAKNNWHSHRVKLATAGAFLSGDAQLIERARRAFERQVMNNIDARGQCWDFVQRDAMHYVVYTLEPLLMSASMAAAHGEDWFNSTAIDDRLRKALDWLSPYALGELQHEEFARTTVEFDRKRARTGVPGYSGIWRRDQAAIVYWLAAQFDVRYNAVRGALAAPPPWVQGLYPLESSIPNLNKENHARNEK